MATSCRFQRFARTVEAATGEKGLKKKLAGAGDLSCRPGRQRPQPVAAVAELVVRSCARRTAQWSAGQARRRFAHPRRERRGATRRKSRAWPNSARTGRIRRGGMERGLTSAGNHDLHEREFRARQGQQTLVRPAADERRMAGLAEHHGQGRRRANATSAWRRSGRCSSIGGCRSGSSRASKSPPASAPSGRLRMLGKAALGLAAIVLAAIVAIAEFPDQVGKIVPPLAQVLPPPLPEPARIKEARWLDQNWSTEDRHWFHHASQGTATFPVPYAWFIALEQPGIHLFTRPGLLKDSDYLERFGFLPSPKTIHTDEATLHRFGYLRVRRQDGAGTGVRRRFETDAGGEFRRPASRFRANARRPRSRDRPTRTRHDRADLRGLSHRKHINYKGVSVRFDGGPAHGGPAETRTRDRSVDCHTLSARPVRTLRHARAGSRCNLGRTRRAQERSVEGRRHLLGQNQSAERRRFKDKHQNDTEEGFGRLDALNRIGNQVFYTDLVMSGLTGFENNLHAQDAPVSFPPIWTVPWFLWAQYDASIEQPLIRNAGEALGVSAAGQSFTRRSEGCAIPLVGRASKISPASKRCCAVPTPSARRQSLRRTEAAEMADRKSSPMIPCGRSIRRAYPRAAPSTHEICVECHLGPVNDPVFDTQFPDKSFWTLGTLGRQRSGVEASAESVEGMGTDPAQANVLASRKVDVPGFLDMQPARDMQPADAPGKVSECTDLPLPSTYSTTEMPYSIALMIVVDLVSRKWMNDNHVSEADQKQLWGFRKNCPNPDEGPALSRPPAERRLGDRALPAQRFSSLALLDAQPRGRATETILHGFSRLRSAAGRLSRRAPAKCQNARTGETLFSATPPRIAGRRQQRSRPLARGACRRGRTSTKRGSSAAC